VFKVPLWLSGLLPLGTFDVGLQTSNNLDQSGNNAMRRLSGNAELPNTRSQLIDPDFEIEDCRSSIFVNEEPSNERQGESPIIQGRLGHHQVLFNRHQIVLDL
jgi:hypothetical protein